MVINLEIFVIPIDTVFLILDQSAITNIGNGEKSYSHKSKEDKNKETRSSIYSIVYLGPIKENRYLMGARGFELGR